MVCACASGERQDWLQRAGRVREKNSRWMALPGSRAVGGAAPLGRWHLLPVVSLDGGAMDSRCDRGVSSGGGELVERKISRCYVCAAGGLWVGGRTWRRLGRWVPPELGGRSDAKPDLVVV